MNKAITDGLVLMPPAFADGLDVWSREDGTPGSATYNGATDAALVPADQDFGGCLEILKTESTQSLRYMGETPILPGCYLRITARIKALSGNLPSVRVAAWAGKSGGQHVNGLDETGDSVALTSYGEVVTVSAIVGTGNRSGVDMVWGTEPIYGHFGIDLTGQTGGVVRIDDIVIEDVTSVFHRQLMDWVDVRDFGAIGDGVADDVQAFSDADDAANGKTVLVPAGTYFLGNHMTFENPVRFEGTVTMADNHRLALRRNYELNSYISAFGDEVLAFRKALQALFFFTDHESLDMSGRRLEIDAPLDVASIAVDKDSFEIRRVLKNGQFNVQESPNWDSDLVTSSASYSANNPQRLTNVANIANIPVGSLITGNGVGREVYVRSKNVSAGEITLSQPLYGAPGNQTYTFERFKYALDFSGFTKLSKFVIQNCEVQCNGRSSAIMLAPLGETFQIRDCHITKPKHRGVTSIGNGCQDLMIDRCQFVSNEQSIAVTSRVSLAFNVNANDTKIRANRFQRFGGTGVFFGNGHLIVGNHLFQGDEVSNGPRLGGFIFTDPNVKSVITGNYIDNCSIEMTNEHSQEPNFTNGYSFGGLTITGNIFTTNDVADWFSWIIVKPYGSGQFIQGLSVIGNTFKSLNGRVTRVERVDESFATLDMSRCRNVTFTGNTFNGVDAPAINPVTLTFTENTDASTWTLNYATYLPFGGWARTVDAVVTENVVRNAADDAVFAFPSVVPNAGTDKNYVQLKWPEPVHGTVTVTARCDNPF